MQVIPKAVYGAGFSGFSTSVLYTGVADGFSTLPSSDGAGPSFCKHPLAFDSVFTDLTLYSGAVRSATVTVTLQLDGVDTGIVLPLNVSDIQTFIDGQAVSGVTGDDVTYKVETASTGNPGYAMGMCIGRTGFGHIFGLTPVFGSIADGAVYSGGAFGNGELAVSLIGSVSSNTYSICAIPGTVARLVLKTYATLPDSGTWTGYIRLNGVLQDGTGGTIDTRTVLTGAAQVAIFDFILPVVPPNNVNVVLVRSGGPAPFALAHVGVGVGFIPDDPNAFMFCGGSNDSISNTDLGWNWNHSKQLDIPEALDCAPVGVTGFLGAGMYIERSSAPGQGSPGTGKAYLETLRRDGANTTITVLIDDLALTGSNIGGIPEVYAPGDLITIQTEPFNTPQTSQLHWGLAMLFQPEGCPGLTGDPRTDGLSYVPPVFPPCSGTGTRSGSPTGA